MKASLAILFLFITQLLAAQELLPNPEFRQVNLCCEYHVSCAPMGWWTAHGGTFNFKKNKFDNDGRLKYKPAYFRYRSDVSGHRSYIQAPILCPLDSGEWYTLELLIRGEHYLPAQVGILFSPNYVQEKPSEFMIVDSITGLFTRYRIDSILPLEPDTNLYLSQSRLNRGVQRITMKYRATGNERYLIVGNFKPDAESALKPRLFPLQKPEDILVEVYRISLRGSSGITCNTSPQLKILEAYNRRHTFYGRCSDTAPKPMDLIFNNCEAWQPYYQKGKKQPSTQQHDQLFHTTYVLKNIYFEFDSAVLLPQSFPSLDSLIQVMRRNKIRSIRITGHTDSLGSAAYNDSLSLNRAMAVKQYLESHLPDLRFDVIGAGSRKPIDSNQNEKGRARNRRVEVIFLE